MRNSSSYAGVSSHRSESMQSVNSFASRSSACSDIGRCTLSNHTCSIPENDVDKDWQLSWILCFYHGCVSSCSVNNLFCCHECETKGGATNYLSDGELQIISNSRFSDNIVNKFYGKSIICMHKFKFQPRLMKEEYTVVNSNYSALNCKNNDFVDFSPLLSLFPRWLSDLK